MKKPSFADCFLGLVRSGETGLALPPDGSKAAAIVRIEVR